jgi:hypothetical protein
MSSDGRLVCIPTERDGSSGGRVSAPSRYSLAAVGFGNDDAAVHGSEATTLCAWESMQNVLEPRSRWPWLARPRWNHSARKTDERVAVPALVRPRPAARRARPSCPPDGARATDDGVSALLEAPLREKRLGVSRGDRVAP